MNKKLIYIAAVLMFLINTANAQWLSPNALTNVNTWSAAPGFISYYNTAGNTPMGQGYGSGVQMVLGGDTRFGSQIIIPTFNDQMFFRRYADGVWDSWITVWSSNNLNKPDVDFSCRNLRANGNLWAKEIRVAVNNPWPDYVFAKKYKLPSLAAVERHIQLKGHLPDMPSAAQVSKQGVSVGDMNAKLLEKVEQLTLYLITLKKEHRALKSELKSVQNQVRILKSESR